MKLTFIFAAAFIFSACALQKKVTTDQQHDIVTQGKLFATLYQQRAAEYQALCYQAFNFAKLRVDQWQRQASAKPVAIVTDIDETVLDNSPYAAHQGLQGKDYNQETWEQWTAMAKADTVPGALWFLKYAASKGIEIFYITNRGEKERAATLMNLQRWQFPNSDNDHLVLRQTTSSKEARRQAVLKTHDILLLMGDNLTDFSALYDKKSYEERLATTQQLMDQFGSKFIVLPNPVYGDWETSLYKYNYGLLPAQKDSVVKKWLKTY